MGGSTHTAVIEIKDGVVVNKVTLEASESVGKQDATTYRVEKVTLYDEQSTYVDLSIEGKILGESHYEFLSE